MDTIDIAAVKTDYVARFGRQTIDLLAQLGGDPDETIRSCLRALANLPPEYRAVFRIPYDPAFSAHEAVIREIIPRYFSAVSREDAAATLRRITRHEGCTVCICRDELELTFHPSAYAAEWHRANPDQPPLIPLSAERD